jgi:hypothetical protein
MALGGSSELDCRAGNQCGAENGENGLMHNGSPHVLCEARQRASRISAAHHITMALTDYCDRGYHEAASKFLNQKASATK